MYNLLRKLFICLLLPLFFFPAKSSAQNQPYSQYGIGLMHPTSFSVRQGMGGISAGYRNVFNLNITNPASYSAMTEFMTTEDEQCVCLVTFETGAYFNLVTLKQGDSTYRDGDGSLDYIAFGIPITKRWGTSFGLLPYSRVQYNFGSTWSGDPATRTIFSGTGDVYQAYFGNGYRVGRFSAGVNVGLLFGRVNHSQIITFPDTLQYFQTRSLNIMRVRNFYWNAGLQYMQPVGSETTLTIGVYGHPSLRVGAEYIDLWERLSYGSNGQLLIVDTVVSEVSREKGIRLPETLGIGFTFQKPQKWVAGLDVVYKGWSNFENRDMQQPMIDNVRIQAGVEYIENYSSLTQYYRRIQYRLGAYYDTGRLELEGHTINEYGMTFGFSLPVRVRRGESKVNLAFDAGTRGTSASNLTRENFLRINLGFTLNDADWFRRRKFN